MKLKTVIVEDEILGQEVILGILKNYCNDTIEIAGVCSSVNQAIESINAHHPQLIFLDIKLGNDHQGAFNILKAIEKIDFKIIFTTSSEQTDDILHAINKYGAKKYLLKPLDIDEVLEAVELVKNEIESSIVSSEINEIKNLIHEFHTPETNTRLRIPVKNGFQFIPCEEIIMLRSHLNSSLIFRLSDDAMTSSKNLGYFSSLLPEHDFIQVSRSYIINVKHVLRYSSEDGGTIYLRNGCTAPLSSKYKDGFFDALDH